MVVSKDKINITLRVSGELIRKNKGKVNFSKFFEHCLYSLDNKKDVYINLKTGELLYE